MRENKFPRQMAEEIRADKAVDCRKPRLEKRCQTGKDMVAVNGKPRGRRHAVARDETGRQNR